MNFTIESINEIENVARVILDNLQYKTICFEGEMGAGKTTFIKKFVEILNTKDEVTSPTFSIVNEYETEKGKVFHFDFYRLNSEEEALDFGIEDYFSEDVFCLLEWPSIIENLIPEKHHVITIKNINNIRYIEFN